MSKFYYKTSHGCSSYAFNPLYQHVVARQHDVTTKILSCNYEVCTQLVCLSEKILKSKRGHKIAHTTYSPLKDVFLETSLLFKELNVNNEEFYEKVLIKKMYTKCMFILFTKYYLHYPVLFQAAK